MNDGLKQLYPQKPSLSFTSCICHFIEAAEKKEQADIVEKIILDVCEKTTGRTASVYLLEDINKKVKGPNYHHEDRSVILGTFEDIFPDDDSFDIPLGLPENIEEFLMNQTRECVNYLLQHAKSLTDENTSSSQVGFIKQEKNNKMKS